VLAFIIRRLVWAVLLAVVITLFTFIIFFVIPTDARSGQLGRGAVQGSIEPTLDAQFRLRNQSVTEQYVHFLKHVFWHGDLGRSIRTEVPVKDIILRALPVTASLVIGGAVTLFLLAFPIGILSALRPRSLLDKGLMILVLIGISAHPIWLGLALSYALGFKLHVFPITGYCDFFSPSTACGGPTQWTYHLLLPWFTFALLFAAVYARMIRASVLETMDEDYVRTARAKGAGSVRIFRSHVLRNAMLPIASMIGMDIGIAFGGSLFIEIVYGLPGIGKVLVRALAGGDLPVIMGVVLVVSFAVAVANLLVDIFYCAIDPRVRVAGGEEGTGTVAPPRRHRRTQPRMVGQGAHARP